MKLNDDKYNGKVMLIEIPNIKRAQWRWIVRKTDNDRYIVRAPKLHILIKNLKHKRNADFKDEMLLPNGSIIDPFNKKTKKWKKTNKNKYNKTRRKI